MFERPQKEGERTLLVHIDFKSHLEQGDLAEFQILALSAGAEVLGSITGKQTCPESKYLLRSGKVAQIAEFVEANRIDLVLIDHPLSP